MKNLINNGFNILEKVDGELLSPFGEVFGEDIEYEIKVGSKFQTRNLYAIVIKYNSDNSISVFGKISSIYKDYSKLASCIYYNDNGDRELVLFFLTKNDLADTVLYEEDGISIKIITDDFVKINKDTKLWEKMNGIDFADLVIDDVRVFNNNVVLDVKKYQIEDVKEKLSLLGDEYKFDSDKILLTIEALVNEFADTTFEDEATELMAEYFSSNQSIKSSFLFNQWYSFKGKTKYTLEELFKNIKEVSDYDKFNKFLTSSTKVTIPLFKENVKKYKLKDYELEMSMDNIQYALEKGEGKKLNTTIIKKIFKDIEKEQAEDLGKIAIGLDNTLAQIVLRNNFDGGKTFVNIEGNVFFYDKGCWRMGDVTSVQKIVLDGIRNVINSENPEYDAIKSVIFLKKANDSLDTLTSTVTNLIMKDCSDKQYNDTLNLRGTKELPYSIINTLNKEIYIQDGKVSVKNHSYDSYLTTQYNVYYNPEADCPNWDQMLHRVFADYPDRDDMVRHFYEIIGYSIQNKKTRPLVTILLGSGKNGKTFILTQIAKMLGVDSVLTANICKFFEGAHSTASLVGKTWLLDDDWKKGQLLPDDQIKSLSENKMITANPKGKSTFNFMSNVTIFINSNSSPRTKDTSEGMARRVQVIEFNREIKDSEQDPLLEEKLAKERSGLLNRLIDGYIRYVKRGYKFEIPMSVQKSNRDWFKASNPLVAYLDEKYIFTGDRNDKIKVQQIFDGYKNYLDFENQSNHSVTRNNFIDEMKNMGSSRNISVVKNSHDTTYYVHGIRAKTPTYIEPAKLTKEIHDRIIERFGEENN